MNNSFGENLQRIRKEKKITQQELATRLNITKNTISNWETNLTQPSIEQIKLLCEMFEITPNELYGSNKETKEISLSLGTVTLEEMEYLLEQLKIFRKMKNKEKDE